MFFNFCTIKKGPDAGYRVNEFENVRNDIDKN